MEKSRPLKKLPAAGQVATTAALILLGWGSASYAATINKADCDVLPHSTDSLSLRSIDHGPIHQDSVTDIDVLQETAAIENVTSGDSATPFLYLTPRVASVLREIFDTSDASETITLEDANISSPVAGTDDVSESVDSIDESPITESIDDDFDRHILQRQMFRTDI